MVEIENFKVWHALLVAFVLVLGATLLIWREKRQERLAEGEFGKSLLMAVGMACLIAAMLYVLTRFIHPIRIRSYGVMLMLAFAAGIGIAMSRAPRYQIEPYHVIDLSLFVLLGSILGARLFYIILNWDSDYANNPASVLNVWEGGLTFHGGLLGGTILGYLFCRWRRIRPTLMIDLVAPSLAFGYALARIGCFINGCCSGGPCNLPWAVDFQTDTVAGIVHPTQLYSSIGHVLVGLVLLKLATRVRVPGHVGLWFLVLSSIVRGFVEVFRRGYSANEWALIPAITQAQAASLAIIIFAVVLLIRTRKRIGYPLPPIETSTLSPEPQRASRSHPSKYRR
ncbi:MAG: prolipoprotein diacylglyceryl transferase [Candidatus Zipacnadales bacterium]